MECDYRGDDCSELVHCLKEALSCVQYCEKEHRQQREKGKERCDEGVDLGKDIDDGNVSEEKSVPHRLTGETKLAIDPYKMEASVPLQNKISCDPYEREAASY